MEMKSIVYDSRLTVYTSSPDHHSSNIRGNKKGPCCRCQQCTILAGWPVYCIWSSDGTIRIWNAETRDLFGQPLEGHNGRVWSVASSLDGRHIFSGPSDKTVRIWDAKTGEPIGQPFEGHTDDVNTVTYSPSGRRIVSGSDDHTVRVWDAETGDLIDRAFEGHRGAIWSVVCSPKWSTYNLWLRRPYDSSLGRGNKRFSQSITRGS
jgi:WD40 repeat protein